MTLDLRRSRCQHVWPAGVGSLFEQITCTGQILSGKGERKARKTCGKEVGKVFHFVNINCLDKVVEISFICNHALIIPSFQVLFVAHCTPS